MKIVHYSYDHVRNPRCGGGGAFRELMIHKELAARHEIIYYCGMFEGASAYNESGIQFRFLGIGTQYLISRIMFSLFATIHSCFVKADIIVIAYSVFSPVFTYFFRNKKTILEFYHITGKEPFRKYSVLGILPWLAERAALHFAKNFITLTDSMAEYIRTTFKGKQVCAAYTGFDMDFNTPCFQDDQYILNFGRIDIHMKGLDILLDAFDSLASQFPEYRLKLAGRGSEKDIDWLNKRINRSNAKDRIQFFHNVGKDQKLTLFRHATFLCMPSRFEGWCISAIEAGASSKATIGTRIMGLGDAIKDNETGLLVPPQDSVALSEAMKSLIQNPDLRKKLGENGHVWAQNFTWERVAGIQENFYAIIVSQK